MENKQDNPTQPPVVNTTRVSTGLGVKVMGSGGLKSAAAGSSTGRTLVRGSRATTTKKEDPGTTV
jgi:hypothetical protein